MKPTSVFGLGLILMLATTAVIHAFVPLPSKPLSVATSTTLHAATTTRSSSSSENGLPRQQQGADAVSRQGFLGGLFSAAAGAFPRLMWFG